MSVITDVIQFSEDESINRELRESATQAVWDIVLSAKKTPAYQITPEVINLLLGRLGKDDSSYFVANVLLEFYESSWPFVLEQVQSNDPLREQVILDLLGRMVNQVNDLSLLYGMLEYGDDDLKVKVVNLLFSAIRTKPSAFAVLLNHFPTFSPQAKEVFFKNLQKILSEESFRQIEEISTTELSDQDFIYLFKEFFKPRALASEMRHNEIADSLFLNWIKTTPGKILLLAKIFPLGETSIDQRIIRYLGYYPGSDNLIKKILLEEVYNGSFERQMLAIYSLGQQSSDAEEKLSVFLKLLKKIFSEKDFYQKEQIILTVAQSILRFPTNSISLQRLEPYFIQALSFEGISGKESIVGSLNFEQALSVALNYLGIEIVPDVLKHLKKESTTAKIRSLRFLKKYLSANYLTTKSIVYLLNDPDRRVREEAIGALSVADLRIAGDLKKAASNFNLDGRNAAWETLLNLEIKDPQVQKNYRDLFYTQSCENKLNLVSRLIKNDIQNKIDLQLPVLDCFLQKVNVSDQDFLVIRELSPLVEVSKTKILTELKEKKLDLSFLFNILKYSQLLGFNDADLFSSWSLILENGDLTLKKEALDYLINKRIFNETIIKFLKSSFDNSKEDFFVRTKAAFYLLSFTPDKEEYQQYFQRELLKEKYQWVLAAISEFNLSEIVELLKITLKNCPAQRKASILQTLGNFGEKASGATEIFLYYIKDKNELISYQSTLALLKVNPLNNALAAALKKQMLGRYASQILLEKNIPSAASVVLEKVKEEAQTIVEIEISSSLLKKIMEK